MCNVFGVVRLATGIFFFCQILPSGTTDKTFTLSWGNCKFQSWQHCSQTRPSPQRSKESCVLWGRDWITLRQSECHWPIVGFHYLFSTKVVWRLVWSWWLILNQFFVFQKPKEPAPSQENGFESAPTCCWSKTKTLLRQGLVVGLQWQTRLLKLCDCHF